MWFKKRQRQKAGRVNGVTDLPTIPEGWFVYECGQSLTHMLWFCHVVNVADVFNKVNPPRHIWTEEHETLQEALQECIQRIKQGTKNETMDGRA